MGVNEIIERCKELSREYGKKAVEFERKNDVSIAVWCYGKCDAYDDLILELLGADYEQKVSG